MHQALTARKKASELAPDDHRIRYNRAMALLLMGEFEEGLSEFEHRRWVTEIMPWKISGPEWTGEEPAGKHILVHAEQGLGDAIQFARFYTCWRTAAQKCILPLIPHSSSCLSAHLMVSSRVCRPQLMHYLDTIITSPLLGLPHRIDPRLESLKKYSRTLSKIIE